MESPLALALCVALRRARLASSPGAHLPAAQRAHRRPGQHHLARDAGRAGAQARRARAEVGHPARRRHGEYARGPGDRALCQRAVPLLEARREEQEQRRAAAGGAQGAAGAHRSGLWPGRHADRCPLRRDHRQRHHAALQDRRLRRRHHPRRRRHHHRADHRCVGMAEAAVAPARPAAGGASDQLGRAHRLGRVPRPAGRLAGLPHDGVRHAADGTRRLAAAVAALAAGSAAAAAGGGGFSGGGGSSGGGGASGRW